MKHSTLILLLFGCASTPTPPEHAVAEFEEVASPSESPAESNPAPAPAAAARVPAAPPDVAAPPADAVKTPTGIASVVLQPGTGTARPRTDDRVTIHYTGWTTDGELIDSTLEHGRPSKYQVRHMSPGWSEGLQLMTVGEKRRFWIPERLVNVQASEPGAAETYVVYEIELFEIVSLEVPPTPKDVSGPPRSAKRTKSGLAYVVLEQGTGTTHPSAASTILVEYTGWTRDGQRFDSSIPRGEPFRFRLEQVIPGWQEGIPLMVAGERTRFWIPAALAYGDKPKSASAPAGMLVFDVKLLDVIPDTP